jgi:hypothetical protein
MSSTFMEKTNANTALAIVFIASAVIVIGGLAAMSLITTAMAAKPDFQYCAFSKTIGLCSDTKEQCESARQAFTDIKQHCHPVQSRDA